MPPFPLFSRDELSAAFALVFRDPATADRVATEWFVQIANSDVDEQGRFLLGDWTGEVPSAPAIDQGLVIGSREVLSQQEPEDADRRFFGGWDDQEKAEYLLRFSDFHLALLALVSPELNERMRIARRMTPEAAARSHAQLSRSSKLCADWRPVNLTGASLSVE